MAGRRDRNFVAECGNCKAVVTVNNAAIERTGACQDCAKLGTDPDDGIYLLTELVCAELGWCACGNPEDVDDWMASVLRAYASDEFPRPIPEGMAESTWVLLSYMADDLAWIEHGSVVTGGWLTDAGHTALANLTAMAPLREALRG